jgi:hypothetical protein
MAEEREIIFEFLRAGGAVKVTAVDVESGTEVSIVGDPAAPEAMLKRVAKQKLDWVMGKQAKG